MVDGSFGRQVAQSDNRTQAIWNFNHRSRSLHSRSPPRQPLHPRHHLGRRPPRAPHPGSHPSSAIYVAPSTQPPPAPAPCERRSTSYCRHARPSYRSFRRCARGRTRHPRPGASSVALVPHAPQDLVDRLPLLDHGTHSPRAATLRALACGLSIPSRLPDHWAYGYRWAATIADRGGEAKE